MVAIPVDDPPVTGVEAPGPGITEATVLAELDQIPVPGVDDKVVEDPWQTWAVPEMIDGSAFTVTGKVVEQPAKA